MTPKPEEDIVVVAMGNCSFDENGVEELTVVGAGDCRVETTIKNHTTASMMRIAIIEKTPIISFLVIILHNHELEYLVMHCVCDEFFESAVQAE